MLDYICDKQPEVRQASVYGVGVMAQFGGKVYAPTCAGNNVMSEIHQREREKLGRHPCTEWESWLILEGKYTHQPAQVTECISVTPDGVDGTSRNAVNYLKSELIVGSVQYIFLKHWSQILNVHGQVTLYETDTPYI